MNIKALHITSIFLLVLALAASNTVLAGDIVINSATPTSAEQGTIDLEVTIAGTGFDNTVEVVEFLLPCTPEPCNGTDGGITVTKFKVRGSKKIIANINVSDTAEAAGFDIAVTRGRGGKGTTFKGLNKFTVKLKPKGGFAMDDITVQYWGLAWEEAFQPGDIGFPVGWENWDANTLDDWEIPRPCFVGAHPVDPPSAGRYDCAYVNALGGRISIDLVAIEGINWGEVPASKGSKSNPAYCDLLNDWDTLAWEFHSPGEPLSFGADRYKIMFLDGCTDTFCPIDIRTPSWNGTKQRRGGEIQMHPFKNLPFNLPDVGRVRIDAWSEGQPAPDDLNPFVLPQTLEINRFVIFFVGSKGTETGCETTGPISGVFVLTDPDPVSN